MAVPPVAAQEAADRLVEVGITSIPAFAPRPCSTPGPIQVCDADLAVELQILPSTRTRPAAPVLPHRGLTAKQTSTGDRPRSQGHAGGRPRHAVLPVARGRASASRACLVVVVGANHRTAPLDLPERMAVSGERLPSSLHASTRAPDTSEVGPPPATAPRYQPNASTSMAHAEVRDFFADLTFLPPERFAESPIVHHDDAAVRHPVRGDRRPDPGAWRARDPGQVGPPGSWLRHEAPRTTGLPLSATRRPRHRGARTETSIARHVTRCRRSESSGR